MRVFTDYDQFADALGAVSGRFIPTAPSRADWWINGRHVGRLKLQEVQIGAPSSFAGDGAGGVLSIGIPISDPTAIRIDGQTLVDDSFIVQRAGQPVTYCAKGPTTWACLTMPLGADCCYPGILEWAARPGQAHFRSRRSALRRVTLLVRWLCTDHEAIDLRDHEAVTVAEQDVLAAVAELMRTSSSSHGATVGRPRLDREQLMARCLAVLRENESQPVQVTDLRGAAQVSERTLRSVFVEYFGVAPGRFLKAHQLYEINRALRSAENGFETVSAIASRFGVCDFSLFARNYRALYGESPSETLRLARERRTEEEEETPDSSSQSWIGFAERCFEAH
jgi:AraC family transcriptional regulator, ethanolamine operon transcriptional activator